MTPARPRDTGRERLAFTFGRQGTVPSQSLVAAALASAETPTFSTAAYAEPRDWGYVGLLAFTFVLLFRPQDQIPGLGAVHVAEICALIGIGPMLLHRFARQQPVFRVTAETIALAFFGAVILATAPFSIWPGGAVATFTDEYVKVLVVFVLMMNTLTTPKRLEQVMTLILWCIGYVALRGVIDYARGANLLEGNRLTGAVAGIYDNPNDLALAMVTFLPFGMVTALSPRHSALKRTAAAAICALMLATIVFTKSRGGMIGLASVVLALVFLGGRVRRGFGAAVIAVMIAAAPFAPASFWTRMASIVDERQDAKEFTGSREARRVLMEEAVDTFAEYPLTGVGAGQFKNYNPRGRQERWRETHNTPLQVAAETGVFGLLAFTTLIVCAGLGARRTRRMLRDADRAPNQEAIDALLPPADRAMLREQTVALSVSLVGWFVCAMFASVAYSWTFYYLLALIVAARELSRHRLAAADVLAEQARAVPPRRFGYRWQPSRA